MGCISAVIQRIRINRMDGWMDRWRDREIDIWIGGWIGDLL